MRVERLVGKESDGSSCETGWRRDEGKKRVVASVEEIRSRTKEASAKIR
jgi:hypothetical protein